MSWAVPYRLLAATVSCRSVCCALMLCVALAASTARGQSAPGNWTLTWDAEMLSIQGQDIPGGAVQIWYIEAFCRAGSTARAWEETVIPHRTELLSATPDGRVLELVSRLDDGVQVRHRISVEKGAIDFRLTAHNPTDRPSAVHWGQPCMRVRRFTGREQTDYLSKSFVFLDGQLSRLPTEPWATEARYTPGQVWCPAHVDRNDVNPRPLSSTVPSNGLVGCFSQDEKHLLAMAFEPYQELFQGVAVCLHADFRIGGLEPGETKRLRGKIYLLPADVAELLRRYTADFPEHQPSTTKP